MANSEFSTPFVVGRYRAMEEGMYFVLSPDGEELRWSKAQVEDVMKQSPKRATGGLELKAVSGEEMLSLHETGMIVDGIVLRSRIFSDE